MSPVVHLPDTAGGAGRDPRDDALARGVVGGQLLDGRLEQSLLVAGIPHGRRNTCVGFDIFFLPFPCSVFFLAFFPFLTSGFIAWSLEGPTWERFCRLDEKWL
jgi:hypothetical protein